LIEASSDTVSAFDTAISTMYPEQDESEIDTALAALATKSKRTVSIVQSRIPAGEKSAARDQLATFLTRWLDRLEKETRDWEERRLSLGVLRKALP
jgi:hypothetical protein